jgi:hypothetical protein
VEFIPLYLGFELAEFWQQYESVNERVIALARAALRQLFRARERRSFWALRFGRFRLMTEL